MFSRLTSIRRIALTLLVSFASIASAQTEAGPLGEPLNENPDEGAATVDVPETPKGSRTKWTNARTLFLGLSVQRNMTRAALPQMPIEAGPVALNEIGGGIAAEIGFSITPTFAMRVTGELSNHLHGDQDEIAAASGSLSLEAMFRLAPHARTQPYLFFGVGGAFVGVEALGKQAATGGGLTTIGFGFRHKFSRHFSLDLSSRLDNMSWNETRITEMVGNTEVTTIHDPLTEEGTAGKFRLGLIWEI